MSIHKLISGVIAVGLLVTPAAALAQSFDDSKASKVGFNIGEVVGGNLQGIEPANNSLVNSIIGVINALLVLAAIAAVVFMIIGGVRYISSQGDEDAVEQAKNTVIYAVIGIIVIILSAVIVNFFVAAL